MWHMMLLAMLLFACGDEHADSENYDEEVYIYTASNAESRKALSLQASAPSSGLAAKGYHDYRAKFYTESIYADVTASDRLQLVFLLDDAAALGKERQKLAAALPAMLKHVINSDWSIAVTTLHAAAYPQATISKYEHSFDYEQLFSQAVTALPQAAAADGGEAQDTVRAFVLLTNGALTSETRHNVEKMLTSGYINRVYALLDTEGRSSSFIDWRDARGQKVINRYASLAMEDYSLPLQEMSRDLASVLRSNFFLRGYRSLEGRQVTFDGDYLQAKVAVNPSRSGQTGHVHPDNIVRGHDKNARHIFINSRLTKGMCLDVKYHTDP